WVTTKMVIPSSRLRSKKRSSTSRPVFESRLPVGSSARSNRGPRMRARAEAHPLENRACAVARVGAAEAGDERRHHRVFDGVELGQQMVELKHEGDLA